MINWIKSRTSMTLKEKGYFHDSVAGKAVNLYVDCFGVEWMSFSKFGHRIKKS